MGSTRNETTEDDSSETVDRVWDVAYDPTGDVEYECLDCGVVVVVGDEHSLTCPTCNAPLRNRSMPIE